MSEEKEKRERPKPVFFHIKGMDFQINPKFVTEIKKGLIFDNTTGITFYTIEISKYFEEQTIIKFTEEDVRDKEHLNFLSKMEEQGIQFL